MAKKNEPVTEDQKAINERISRLNSVVGAINKKFGAPVVMRASDAVKQGLLSKKIIPTPSVELNEALWCGGFCGVVELYGANSSGKTSLAIDTIVKNQNEDSNFIAGWLETEGSITKEILEDHGVQLDRLIFFRQEDVVNAENSLDIVRALIADGTLDMIVINSVAGLTPSTEAEDDLKKQNIALTARILSKFFRVANGEASKNDVALVFINQIRDNVGVMYGDTTTTTGGRAIGFYANQRIRMSMLKLQTGDPILPEEGVKIGFGVKKNRFAGKHNPYTKGEYYAIYGRGIDSTVALPAILAEKGIMRNAGAWWYYEDANGNIITIDGIPGKFKSKKDFVNVLSTNKAWKDEMMSKVSLVREQTTDEIREAEEENKAAEEVVAKEQLSDDINDLLEANSNGNK